MSVDRTRRNATGLRLNAGAAKTVAIHGSYGGSDAPNQVRQPQVITQDYGLDILMRIVCRDWMLRVVGIRQWSLGRALGEHAKRQKQGK
jgi:hypothetical protein